MLNEINQRLPKHKQVNTMNRYCKKINFSLLASVLFLSLFSSTVCSAGDIKAGKTKAAACAGCHGIQGISNAPNYPNLAGQKELYLTTAINSYRTGGRNDPTMKAMVASLTDTDVANLAAHFASLAGN